MDMLLEFCGYVASDLSTLMITIGLSFVIIWAILRIIKKFREWDESYKHEDLSR